MQILEIGNIFLSSNRLLTHGTVFIPPLLFAGTAMDPNLFASLTNRKYIYYTNSYAYTSKSTIKHCSKKLQQNSSYIRVTAGYQKKHRKPNFSKVPIGLSLFNTII